MIKLVRNTLGSIKIIYEGKSEIKWKFYEDLVSYSGDKTFGLTHKMNKRHIQFHDRKMHVRTAVESLSGSVSDSMELLMKNGVPEFTDASTTIKFNRMFNRLWDIMNTQRIRSGESNQ